MSALDCVRTRSGYQVPMLLRCDRMRSEGRTRRNYNEGMSSTVRVSFRRQMMKVLLADPTWGVSLFIVHSKATYSHYPKAALRGSDRYD